MKGVTPDVEIKPNFQQILERKDIELEWILKEIKGK
jgi:C-terminal processing protease CtpA/Prc